MQASSSTKQGCSFSRCLWAKESFIRWDAFQYESALEGLIAVMQGEKLSCRVLTRLIRFLADLATELSSCRQTPALAGDDDCMRQSSLVLDLLANARRRGDESRYTDGLARLYCAVERSAKHRLALAYGIDNSAVHPSRLPAAFLGQELAGRLLETGQAVKLPLHKSYALLAHLGDPLGVRYEMRKDWFRDLSELRNGSILGHGLQTVNAVEFEFHYSESLDFLGVRQEELPIFPERILIHLKKNA